MLLRRMGHAREAEPLLRKALQSCEAALGPSSVRTEAACNNLGSVLEAIPLPRVTPTAAHSGRALHAVVD